MHINASFDTSVHSAEVAAFLRSRPDKTGEIWKRSFLPTVTGLFENALPQSEGIWKLRLYVLLWP